MKHEIIQSPTSTRLQIHLGQGERFQAKDGSTIRLSQGIHATASQFDLLTGLRLKTYTAGEPGTMELAPDAPGDIEPIEVGEKPFYVQPDSLLAATQDISIKRELGLMQTLFSKKGAFPFAKCTGHGTVFVSSYGANGTVFVSSYGAIRKIELDPNDVYTINTGHITALDHIARRSLELTNYWKNSLADEELTCCLQGPGLLYTQTLKRKSP